MKKHILLALAIIGTLTFNSATLLAQDQPPPGAPPAGQPPPPAMRPAFPPGMRGNRASMTYRRAIAVLRQTKMELQRSKEDFDGHRQTAMDAIDTTVQELEAVQKSIQAAQAAKAAAAAAAAAQQQNAQQPVPPAPAPAPATPQ